MKVAMVFGIVVYATRMPSWDITAITVLWVLFATLFNVAVGNIRSIVSPKKMDPGKLARKQASQLSALISIGVMLSTAALTGGVYLLGGYLARPWVPFPILLALAVAGLITYLRVLRHTDTLALTHRETLLEELGKPS
jgi:ABC-2 type transport system permease protein